MPESNGREGSAPLSEKGRRSKRPNRRKRAKQWTFLIEKLKLAVDGLYEMCREEQNLNGCKEAFMYLQNSARDFESLIASIHVEISWEEKEKPQAVAWEIRKSMSSPSPAAVMKDASSIMNQIPLMFSEVVKAASDRKHAVVTPSQEKKENEKKNENEDADENTKGDEWQVVQRGRRKKSLSSMTSESREDLDFIENTDAAKPSNVYERLAGSNRRYPPANRGPLPPSSSNSSNYMCPKSAMDLPQTKASMAKMAYSRQLLWQRSQSTLIEKMKARQARQKNADFNGGTNHNGGGQKGRVVLVVEGGEKKKFAPEVQNESSRNLTSIRETQEDDKGEIIPVDPKPSTSDQKEGKLQEEEILLSTSSAPPTIQEGSMMGGRDDEESRLSFPLSNPELLNLESDREWREMTEEEESLAFEERSLNIEIEQAKNLSIDAELERQVAAEADALERKEEEEEERAREEREEEEEEKVEEKAEEEEKLTYEEMFKRWQEELAELATVSWSELVEREFASAPITHLREPGDAAVRHERMMSPSRTRGEVSEEDMSRRHEEKQKKADELREKLKEEKAARLKGLLQKVEEVREKRAALIERKRALMESRLQTAKENRDRNLEEIVRKAREDESKVKEAQLIHALEKGNMRMDQQMRERRNENRRMEIAEERVKKQEEKAAKEAAAEERRRMNDTRSESSAMSVNDEVMVVEEEEVVEGEGESKQEEEKVVEQPKEEDTVKEEKVEEKKKDKKRKSSKEAKKEEAKMKEEVEERKISNDFEWNDVILNWTMGRERLTEGKNTRYQCTECAIELRSQWECIAHVLTVNGAHWKMMADMKGEERREKLIAELNSCVKVSIVYEDRSGNAEAKNRKRKGKRGDGVRQKENAEMMARAIGGGHGPSVDVWRDLFMMMDVSQMEEKEKSEMAIFVRSNIQKKKREEAMGAFLEKYAREMNDLVFSTVLDACVSALMSDRSIREPAKTREDKEIKEIEMLTFNLLLSLLSCSGDKFNALFSPSSSPSLTRSINLLTYLLHHVDGMSKERSAVRPISNAPAATGHNGSVMTTMNIDVFRLMVGVARVPEIKPLFLLLDAPRRLACLPIAHLLQVPNCNLLLSAIIAVTIDDQEAVHSLKHHLSPWHCINFLKTELTRPRCICPIHAVLPTKEAIERAIEYYERA